MVWLGFAAIAAGQTLSEKPPAEDVTVDAVQNRLKQLEASQNLDDDAKGKLRELYQQVLQELDSAGNWAAAAHRFQQMVVTAPEELLKTKTDLETLPRQSTIRIRDFGLAQLEQTVSQKDHDLTEKKGLLAELETEPQRRANRRVEIPKLVGIVRDRLAEIDKQLQASAAVTEPSEITSASRILLSVRRQAFEQELLCYEKELKAYEARAELLRLRRDLVTRQSALWEQELAQWRAAADRQRQLDAQAQLRRAQSEADQAHPAMAELRKKNAELAERRNDLAQHIAKTTRQLEDTKQKLASLRDQFQRIQGKVETVGLTNAIGLLLRKQREALPDVRGYRRDISSRQSAIREIQLELLEREDRRSELANLEAQIQEALQTAGRIQHAAGEHDLEIAVRSALETEREFLDALISDVNSYFDKLVDLDNAEGQLTEQTQQYAKYIDERVLWIRSAAVFGPSALSHLVHGVKWLTRPQAWIDLAKNLLLDIKDNPLLAALAALIFGPLIISQRRLRRRIGQVGEWADRGNCCSLTPTLEAVVLTALVAGVWPGVLWYASWRVNAAAASSEFSKAVAAGLAYTAGVYLVLEILRQMCRPEGLSEAHFGWPASALKPLLRYIRAAKVLLLPLVFVAVTMGCQENERWADSLGRLGFMAAMLICCFLSQQSLRPAGGIYQAILTTHRGGWLDRLRYLGYPLAVSVPMALAVLAAVGYYYTAQQLAQRMFASAYILLALTLLRSFLLRWVLVNRRRLAIEQFRQRRAASQAESHAAADAEVSSVIPPPTEQTVDLAAINAQTQHLVEYALAVTGFLGIWLVWIDVLPALRVFDRLQLWQTADLSAVVSLADLGLAMLTLLTTLIAAKNMPGLLEMALLQRLPLDAGVRYTVGTVSRYIIVVVGLVVACQMIGLGWTKVQWLIAAVSVGLGFGLQEIFANFVSGLIILFERPVRVGDVVTVDDVTGVVSMIRMRATTITNWDRKEFIVPNREFITGRVLNWTLTDQVNRVVVHVGIGYGSDTSLATELLLKVANEHPLVLDDPAPRVTFEEFGESSLHFVLRCYLPDMENRLQVIHDLHIAIDREFRQAGIEIAFPQQDIRIRSVRGNQACLDCTAGTRPDTPRVAQEGAGDRTRSRQVA